MIPYPTYGGVETASHEFYLLRESRNVIKMGRFRMWNGAPGAGCPIQDCFLRRTGLRVFTVHPFEPRD